MTLNLESFNRFAKSFKSGEIVFSEFEFGDNFYLIKSGQVELVKLDGESEKTLTILSQNEMFGEMAILERSPRSATAIAHGDCVLLEFNSSNFQSLMLGLPEMALKLLKSFIERMYDSKDKYKQLKQQDPEERIALTIVQVDLENVEFPIDDSRTFNMTVDNLARRAGLSAVQTNEVLNKLISEKRISIYKGQLIVNHMSYFKNYVKDLQKNRN